MSTSNYQPSADEGGGGRQASEVPLNVWPVRQVSPQHQRAGRYPRENREHPGEMLPELARRIVAEFSSPGDLILDPMAGTGTALAEAAMLGRRCVGIELDDRWVDLARANLDQVLEPDRRVLAEVRRGDARNLPAVAGAMAGRVDLLVVSPPYVCQTGVIDTPGWRKGQCLSVVGTRHYSPDRADIARTRGCGYEQAMHEVYAHCFRVLRPGGLLVTVTKNMRQRGRLRDLAGTTVRLARAAGFVYVQHIVAAHARVRDRALATEPSPRQVRQVKRARASGLPVHLGIHQDVGVFRKPEQPDTGKARQAEGERD